MPDMKTPHMIDWIESPERLERTVFLPGGSPAFDTDERGRRVYTHTGEGAYVRWLEYHRLNPDVFTMAAALAKRLYRANGGYSSRQIMERFRMEMADTVNRPSGQEEFKLNNAHIPFYGRLLAHAGLSPVFNPEGFKTMRKGEPVWWAEYLLTESVKYKQSDPKLYGTMQDMGKSAMAVSMRGTDEAPPVVLP